jgi:large subunit ribosomal protein L22
MDNSILARCLLRDAPLSPQKGRMMADVIRGLPVGAALERLNFSRNKSGGILAKVLNSAVANAENNAGVDIDTLVVTRVEVSDGRHLRRIRFGARGRVSRITRRRSHIVMELGHPAKRRS